MATTIFSFIRHPVLITLLVIRLFVAICGTAYIHPDEHWQSTEVVARDILDLKTNLPWEWSTIAPARSMTSAYVTCAIPIYFLYLLTSLLPCIVLTSYRLFIVTRLYLFVLSFVMDYMIYKIARTVYDHPSDVYAVQLCYASLWPTMVLQVRPFTNSIECFLVCLCLYIVIVKTRSVTSAMTLGCLGAVGCFIRITVPLFLLPLSLYTLWTSSSRIHVIIYGILSFIVTCCFLVFIDSIYYHSVSWKFSYDLLSFPTLVGNPTLSMWNNLKYNFDPNNLANHGIHSSFTHFIINFPLLFGPLSFSFYMKTFVYQNWNLKSSGVFISLVTIYFSMFCLSLFQHQEPRFLLPLVAPLCVVGGPLLRYLLSVKCLFLCWFLFNFTLVLFYGFIHQGGIVPSLIDLQSDNKQYLPIIYYHTYPPPESLLLRSSELSGPVVYDLKCASTHTLITLIESLKNNGQGFYLVYPGTIYRNLHLVISNNYYNVMYTISTIHQYFPHFSGEDVPDWLHSSNLLSDLSLFVDLYVP